VILKPLFEYFGKLFSLARDVQEVKEGFRELRAELDETNEAVQRLAADLRVLNEREANARERERSEREKLHLQLENVLLKFQKQIGSGKKKR